MTGLDEYRRSYLALRAPASLGRRALMAFESTQRGVARGPVFALAMTLVIAVAFVPLIDPPQERFASLSLASLQSPPYGSMSFATSGLTTPARPGAVPSLAALVTPTMGSWETEEVN